MWAEMSYSDFFEEALAACHIPGATLIAFQVEEMRAFSRLLFTLHLAYSGSCCEWGHAPEMGKPSISPCVQWGFLCHGVSGAGWYLQGFLGHGVVLRASDVMW